MVGHNPQFIYCKDGVFYFSRRIPKDIRDHYEDDKFVMSSMDWEIARSINTHPPMLQPSVTINLTRGCLQAA